MNPRDPHYPNRSEWLKRPARKQVDDVTLQKEIQARGGLGERNLWSGRRIGPSVGPPSSDGKRGGPGVQRVKDASKYRCVVELDVGRTRGSDAKQHVFCLYFAKGCCSQGSACIYLHRLPTADDEANAVRDLSADIFGREKRAESEGYRSGAGTLDRDNRTLYVNYEGAGAYDLPKIRQLLEANFRVFGPVNNIYIVHNKTIAFVRYDWRSSAEFAKEAMHKQSLVGSTLGEVITARWANEDPNPVAVLAQKRACEEAFGLAVMSSFDALPPEQKQARIMELQLQSALQRGTSIGAYPRTDEQFTERERQQQELEIRCRQQEQEQQVGPGDGFEDEDDIPYIPTDIYEEQQRLIAQQREAGEGSAQTTFGPPPAATAEGQHEEQKQRLSIVVATAGPGDLRAAAADPTSFSKGTGAGPGAGVEALEWERAWSDPELREQLRNNPELRERMRRARNEAVYWSAYQAHYSAYANSYGHHATERQQEQQDNRSQQWGEGTGYPCQDYEYYYGWYGQQGEPGAGGEATRTGAQPPRGNDVASGSMRTGADEAHLEQYENVGGFSKSGGLADGLGQSLGASVKAADDTSLEVGTDNAGLSAAKSSADGLSLLGATYGSDEEDAG
ncbi:hypothetical protein Vafri_3835 [Volvox africanus]|uniref:C3H1-type domain-containing protein n=1 Tax=Volvox africanus TaxID=51714 RepID=A0A8J4AV71_9CHLO|nr:hypothetical protein Vafri_3835 [Volvox africanus]